MKRTAKELLKAKDQEERAPAETSTLLVHECTMRKNRRGPPVSPSATGKRTALNFDNRKTFLKENRICFSCLESTNHIAKRCEKGKPECATCSLKHAMALHDSHRHPSEPKTDVKCTRACGSIQSTKSCAKIMLVWLRHPSLLDREVLTYAQLDD